MTTISEDDVYWARKDSSLVFNENMALAVLLAEDVVFINSFWWEDTWPAAAREHTSLNVNCNDLFAWACADAEPLLFDEVQSLYDHWVTDKTWGVAKWCAKKRNQKPQPPIVKEMKKEGVWDETMEALGNNYQDAEVQAAFAEVAAPKQGD